MFPRALDKSKLEDEWRRMDFTLKAAGTYITEGNRGDEGMQTGLQH